jgi:hypothetical protein
LALKNSKLLKVFLRWINCNTTYIVKLLFYEKLSGDYFSNGVRGLPASVVDYLCGDLSFLGRGASLLF